VRHAYIRGVEIEINDKNNLFGGLL